MGLWRRFVCPAVCLSTFCFRNRSRKTHVGGFFHIAHTHTLEGVHVPHGIYKTYLKG